MPVSIDLPEYSNAATVEDVNKYQKLPFYLAMLEAKYFPQWQVYNQLFGKIKWQPNMGSTLRGVRAEPTPVSRTFFYPKAITELPQKDVFETLEFTEESALQMHDFDSKQFYFLPSFQDFRENQLDFNHKDIVRQVAVANDTFIRTFAYQKAPYIYICGNNGTNAATFGTQNLYSAPTINAAILSSANAPKNQAFHQSLVGVVGTNLTLAAVDNAVNVMRDDIGAPFFEGTVNTPKDNELIKGKYVLIGSSEAYQQFKWDPDFPNFRNVNFSTVENGFRGSPFDEVTYKTERYPIRIAADGSVPEPEVVGPGNQTVPNPMYVNAPYEVAILVGADAYKTINVGPPPRAFANKKMTAEKFFSMNWNGEIGLTDQVLVAYNVAGQATPTYDLNYRGRFLKLFGSAAMGAIPCNKRSYLPMVFARRRVAVV